MHLEVVVIFIVIEVHFRFAIPFISVIKLLSIALALGNDVSETIPMSSSITVLIAEAASNVGMNLVVFSLINIR